MKKEPTKKRIAKWVEVTCRFYVDAKDQETFDLAVSTIPREVWLAMSSSGGYRIESEPARRGKD